MANEKHLQAAGRLEGLAVATKEISNQLMQGVSPGLAYALVYRLRREIGYVVASLGGGVPTAQYDNIAKEIIKTQIGKDSH